MTSRPRERHPGIVLERETVESYWGGKFIEWNRDGKTQAQIQLFCEKPRLSKEEEIADLTKNYSISFFFAILIKSILYNFKLFKIFKAEVNCPFPPSIIIRLGKSLLFFNK